MIYDFRFTIVRAGASDGGNGDIRAMRKWRQDYQSCVIRAAPLTQCGADGPASSIRLRLQGCGAIVFRRGRENKKAALGGAAGEDAG